MIHMTIDGKRIEVPEGTTVLQAAEKAGIEIPTLCNHPHLTPYGGCRLCLVEVEGARTLQTSCTLPVSNGMVVHTDTPRVHQARKFILTLLFSERNHFCMYCQMSGGDCELQNGAYGEDMTHWPLQPDWQPYPVDGSHEYIVLDHNRCILCRRCVRACGELVGNFTLGMSERGSLTRLTADLDVPLGESTCVSCGTCVQVCPTGALIDRMSAYRGRETDVQRVKSICIGCSVGCGVELITRDNQLLRIEGDWNAPVNEGILCQIGRFQSLTDKRQRILTPMVRKNGELKAATWEEALAYLADRLKPLAGKNGDGVAALVSTRLPNEVLYQFRQLFAEKFGSQMVTSIEEGITVEMAGQVAQEIGKPFEGGLEALRSADCVVAVGVDLIENHQVAGFLVKRALPHGTKLIVIDPFENGLHDLADCSLRPQQGTDHELLRAIISAIVNLGLARHEPDNLADLATHTPEDASQATGIPAETIRDAAQMIARSQNPAFVYGKGVAGQGSAQVLKALVDLARLVGALKPEGSSIIGTKGQANSMAAYLYGLDRPFEVNGHQAVYLMLGDDKVSQRLLQRLEGAPFIAVQASHASPATEMADVVLPVEMWAEQEGHYLNLEGRLQEAHGALTPPTGTWSNVKVLEAIAARTGYVLDTDWEKALKGRTPITTMSGTRG
ncbi:MAG: formate dehydrogenase subunit alpha [Anaerolineae bacterium]